MRRNALYLFVSGLLDGLLLRMFITKDFSVYFSQKMKGQLIWHFMIGMVMERRILQMM